MRKKIVAHIKTVDPILGKVIDLIDDMPLTVMRTTDDYFVALTNEIISQQLSGRVADVIFARFENLFPKKKITPASVVKMDHETLRSTGMSNAKARFIMDLANKVHEKEIDLTLLKDMENEKVIEELTKIKGIGRWTAEMFLMFTLGREDIFSHGDLGLKNAIKKLYQLDNPTKEEIENITIKWSPYRTFACRILWKSLLLK